MAGIMRRIARQLPGCRTLNGLTNCDAIGFNYNSYGGYPTNLVTQILAKGMTAKKIGVPPVRHFHPARQNSKSTPRLQKIILTCSFKTLPHRRIL